jgi:uncharacterized protein
MDVVHRLNGIDFVWSRAKDQANLQKHGASLELACEVFFDPFIRLLRTEWTGGEEREMALGLTKDWTLLVVVYTFRGESIRIISARPATGPERKAYEDE